MQLYFLLFLCVSSTDALVAGSRHERPGDVELVYVKELEVGRQRRSTSPQLLPHFLYFQFNVGEHTVKLRLVRNTDIFINVPFTFAGKKREKLFLPDRQDFALYQDATNGAAISVTTTKAGSGRHARHLVSVK
ncbi:hypothetical protein LSAT2_015251 [Lamellibrachia satsuma]|nr:hypothetical protein LSAT2_015251 [Lamellibrachia satsuma]